MAEVTYRGINIVFDGSLDEGYKTKALSEAIKNIDLIYNNPKTRFILNEMEIRKVELFIHDNNYTKYIPPEEWTTGNPVILFDPFSTTISKGIYDLPMIFSVGSILFHEMYHAFDPALWIEKYKLEPTDPKYTDLSEEIAIFMTNLLYRSHYDEPLRTTHEGTFLKLITPPILQRLNSFFQNLIPSLFQAEQNYSPIIIDLNGDGVQTTTLDDGVYFDHDNNQFAEQTAWVDSNDGLLALDINGDGVINGGAELFGNHTALADGSLPSDGYAALAQYDSNGDGVISSADTIWNDLRIWQDADSDAVADEGELKTLDDLGIASIDLNANEVSETDENGNQISHRGEVNWADGSTTEAEDVWFQVNTAQTQYQGNVDIPEDIAKLPEVRAFGNVVSLQIAMTRDDMLRQMVEDYVSADDETRVGMLNDLIYRWTGSDQVAIDSRGSMDARQVVALEHLTGDTFLQEISMNRNPTQGAALDMQAEFNKFASWVQANLLIQTADYAENILYLYLAISQTVPETGMPDWSAFADHLCERQANGEAGKAKQEYQIIKNLFTYSSKYQYTFYTFLANNIESYAQLLTSGIIEESVIGDQSDNYVTGNYFADNLLLGGEGNDRLSDTGGRDVLIGGAGNDFLSGGQGSADTYLFTKGHGQDFIQEYASGNASADIIRFEGAMSGQAIFLCDGFNLVIKAYGGEDQVSIYNYFNNHTFRYVQFHFMDKRLTINDIAKKTFVLYGSEDRDTFSGWDSNDIIYGQGGDDFILGYGGNDKLYGGEGNDQLIGDGELYGGDGNDTLSGNGLLEGGSGEDRLSGKGTLIGGAGNDSLSGGQQNIDTYLFAQGHGQDTLRDYAYNDAQADTLRFEGANSADAVFSRNGNDLVVKAYGGEDQVSIYNFFAYSYYRHQNFVFDDQTLSTADIASMSFVVYGSENADSISGWDSHDTLYGLAGNDSLSGGNGDDYLDGGDGNDTLSGSSGNNVLIGGNGNDSLTGEGWLQGGAGDDRLSGSNGKDRLEGGDGNDILNSSIGGDTLIGGAGNDSLSGGQNSIDTYLFAQDHGQDTLRDYAYNDTQADILRFEGANSADAVFSRNGNDLVVKAYGGEDQVSIYNFFAYSYYRHQNFVFDDQTLGTADIAQMAFTLYGTENTNDYISGWDSHDTVYGFSGNDYLSDNNGNDTFYGGDGNDTLSSGAGFDTLIGGTGNDTLNGGYEGDTYLVGKGDGADIISDYQGSSTGDDTLKFTDVSLSEVLLQKDGNDLIFSGYEDGDSVQISNFFSNSLYQVENFTFSDQSLTATQVNLLREAMASFDSGQSIEDLVVAAGQEANFPLLAAGS